MTGADVPVAVGAALAVTLDVCVKVVAVPGHVTMAAVDLGAAVAAPVAVSVAPMAALVPDSDVVNASVPANVAVGRFAVYMSV